MVRRSPSPRLADRRWRELRDLTRARLIVQSRRWCIRGARPFRAVVGRGAVRGVPGPDRGRPAGRGAGDRDPLGDRDRVGAVHGGAGLRPQPRPRHGVPGVHQRRPLPRRRPVPRHLRGEREHEEPRVGRADHHRGRRRRGRGRPDPGPALGRRAAARHPRRPDRDGERPGRDVRVRRLRRDLPAGAGKAVAEQVCMACHGENFFPTRPGTQRQWETWIDHMVGSTLGEQDPTRYGQGLLAFRASMFRFGRQDRDDLLAYVVENFGPDSKRRRVRIEQQTPVDEEALGKAMYIEYYLAKDGPGEGVNAEPWARDRVARYGQDPRFDADGNVWLVDRGVPHRLVKLDPRTGEQWEYLYPDPRNGNHEILIDPSGLIWLPEHRGRTGDGGEAAAGVQPRDRGVRVPDSDGPRRRGPQPDEVHAVAGHGLEGQHLRRLDHGRGPQQVGPGHRRGVGVPHPDPARHPLRGGGRPQRQHLDRALERRQDRQVRHVEQLVDGVHRAHLPGAYAAAERRLAEQHLVGHLLGRQARRQASSSSTSRRAR